MRENDGEAASMERRRRERTRAILQELLALGGASHALTLFYLVVFLR